MDFILELRNNWVMINDSFEFEEKDKRFIRRSDDTNLDYEFTFAFKKLEVNSKQEYTLTGAMGGRINSNKSYSIMLFVSPREYNKVIDKQYEILADKIRKLYENIQKGGMFNSDDWMESNLQEIVGDHNSVVSFANSQRVEYEATINTVKDIHIRSNVRSLENRDDWTKKVVFNLWSEDYALLASRVADLPDMDIWLKIL